MPTKLEFDLASTKVNIRHATMVEANMIDKEYPEILESIFSEKHQNAILFITYAWIDVRGRPYNCYLSLNPDD